MPRGPGALADAREAARGRARAADARRGARVLRRRGARRRSPRRPQAAARLDELAAAIVRHGLEARTVVSGVHIADLLAVGRAAPTVRLGITYPEDKLSISRKPYLWPIVSLGLTSMRASVPMRVPRLARLAGASAVMLQHRLVTRVGRRALPRAAGLPVWAWTVDERADLDRVVAAGVDGVITNDPRIFPCG